MDPDSPRPGEWPPIQDDVDHDVFVKYWPVTDVPGVLRDLCLVIMVNAVLSSFLEGWSYAECIVRVRATIMLAVVQVMKLVGRPPSKPSVL